MTAPGGEEFASEMMFPGRAIPARCRPTLQTHPAMRPRTFRAALMGAVALIAVACSSGAPTAPAQVEYFRAPSAALRGTSVRISEIHYDNASTDAGEAIEISWPGGTSLAGWSIVLCNGANSLSYGTRALTSTITTSCGARGVVFETYPANGIQNGNPDGIALVNNTGTVVEFISYGGAFTALNGPATGITSTDIGITEPGTTPLGSSIKRNADGTWSTAAPSNFGTCNDGTTNPVVPAVVASVTVTPATATVDVGATVALTGAALDAAAAPIAGAVLTWSSSANTIATAAITLLPPAVGIARAQAMVTALVESGAIRAGEANSLQAKLGAVARAREHQCGGGAAQRLPQRDRCDGAERTSERRAGGGAPRGARQDARQSPGALVVRDDRSGPGCQGIRGRFVPQRAIS